MPRKPLSGHALAIWAQTAPPGREAQFSGDAIPAAHYLGELGVILTFNRGGRYWARRISPLAARFIRACQKGQFDAA